MKKITNLQLILLKEVVKIGESKIVNFAGAKPSGTPAVTPPAAPKVKPPTAYELKKFKYAVKKAEKELKKAHEKGADPKVTYALDAKIREAKDMIQNYKKYDKDEFKWVVYEEINKAMALQLPVFERGKERQMKMKKSPIKNLKGTGLKYQKLEGKKGDKYKVYLTVGALERSVTLNEDEFNTLSKLKDKQKAQEMFAKKLLTAIQKDGSVNNFRKYFKGIRKETYDHSTELLIGMAHMGLKLPETDKEWAKMIDDKATQTESVIEEGMMDPETAKEKKAKLEHDEETYYREEMQHEKDTGKLEEAVKKYEKDVAELKKENEAYKDAAAKQYGEKTALDTRITGFKLDRKAYLKKRGDLEKRKEQHKKTLSSIDRKDKAKMDAYNKKMADLNAEGTDLGKEAKRLQKESKDIDAEQQRLRNINGNLKSNVGEINKQAKKLKELSPKLGKEKVALKSKKKQLEEQAKKLEEDKKAIEKGEKSWNIDKRILAQEAKDIETEEDSIKVAERELKKQIKAGTLNKNEIREMKASLKQRKKNVKERVKTFTDSDLRERFLLTRLKQIRDKKFDKQKAENDSEVVAKTFEEGWLEGMRKGTKKELEEIRVAGKQIQKEKLARKEKAVNKPELMQKTAEKLGNKLQNEKVIHVMTPSKDKKSIDFKFYRPVKGKDQPIPAVELHASVEQSAPRNVLIYAGGDLRYKMDVPSAAKKIKEIITKPEAALAAAAKKPLKKPTAPKKAKTTVAAAKEKAPEAVNPVEKKINQLSDYFTKVGLNFTKGTPGFEGGAGGGYGAKKTFERIYLQDPFEGGIGEFRVYYDKTRQKNVYFFVNNKRRFDLYDKKPTEVYKKLKETVLNKTDDFAKEVIKHAKKKNVELVKKPSDLEKNRKGYEAYIFKNGQIQGVVRIKETGKVSVWQGETKSTYTSLASDIPLVSFDIILDNIEK